MAMQSPYASALLGGSDPTIAQTLPKSALAQALLQQSMDTSPIRSPWQGAARMAQALVGQLLANKANAPYEEASDLLKRGAAQGTGTPPEVWHNPGAVSPSADGTAAPPIDYQQLPEHAAPSAQDVSYGGTPGDIGAMLKTLGSNPIALERGLPLAKQMMENQQATQEWNLEQPILARALRGMQGTGGADANGGVPTSAPAMATPQLAPTNIGAGAGGNMPTPAPADQTLASNARGTVSDAGGGGAMPPGSPTMAAALANPAAPAPMGGAPAAGGMAPPAAAGGGMAPPAAGGAGIAGLTPDMIAAGVLGKRLGPTFGAIIAKQYPGPTDLQRAQQYAESLPAGPQRDLAIAAVNKMAGLGLMDIKPGAAVYDPVKGQVPFRNPVLDPGIQLNAQGGAEGVPGYIPAAGAVRKMEAGARATFEPQTFIDPNTGAQSTTNRTALASGKPLPTALAPETQARLSAAGTATYEPQNVIDAAGNQFVTNRRALASGNPLPTGLGPQTQANLTAAGGAPFEPQTYFGPGGQAYQGTRASLPAVGGVAAPPPMGGPAGAPAGLPSASGGPPPPNPAAVTGSAPAASATPPTASGRLGPAIPVQTPSGPKDISDLSVNDLFPGGEGIPTPPKPPPGMGYGPPNEAETARQKADASRLEEYAKQASANPKIYQDLAHLQDVLGRGLNTSNVAPAMKELATTAQALGLGNILPKGYDPNDAATFQKAATDLVFESVKKLAGQVKVAEIEGYKQASPNLTIPVATNYSILGDLLANGKWQDARAKLGQEYATKTGGAAPLSAFDAKFNAAAPLPDVTDTIKDKLRQAGARFPGDPGTPSGGPVAAAAPNLSPAIEKQADDISVKFHSGAFGDPADPKVKAKVVDMLKKLGP